MATFESLEQRLAAIPGVRSVGETSHLPLGGRDGRQGVTIEGREPTPDAPTRAHPRVVSPLYFRTMRIQLLAGRPFSKLDAPPSAPVVIVNDTMAKRYWPGGSPLGKRVRFNGTGDPWMEVVGVIADVKHWGLDARVNPEIYLPLKMGFGLTMTYIIDSDSTARRSPAACANRSARRIRISRSGRCGRWRTSRRCRWAHGEPACCW